MKGSSNLDETYREYSLAPTDYPIRFWSSKVKVTAGRRGGENILVDIVASKSIFWFFYRVGGMKGNQSVKTSTNLYGLLLQDSA